MKNILDIVLQVSIFKTLLINIWYFGIRGGG